MTADRPGGRCWAAGGALAVDVKALGKELQAPVGGDRARRRPATRVTRACTRNLIAAGRRSGRGRRARPTCRRASPSPPGARVPRRAERDGGPRAARGVPRRRAARCAAAAATCAASRSRSTVGRRRAGGRPARSCRCSCRTCRCSCGCSATPAWDDELLVRLLDVADRFVVDTPRRDRPGRAARRARRQRARRSLGAGRLRVVAPGAVARGGGEPVRRALDRRPAGAARRAVVRYGAGGSRSPPRCSRAGCWTVLIRARRRRDRPRAARGRRRRRGRRRPCDRRARGDAGARGGGDLRRRAPRRLPRARCAVEASEGDGSLSAQRRPAGRLLVAGASPVDTPRARSTLLEDQLDMPGAWPVYERALARAATLLAGIAPDGG